MTKPKSHIQIKGKNLQIVTLDFETFYSSDYTLSGKNMNMSEYVRDPRFHIHGMALKIGAGRTKWYTGKNIQRALDAIDWTRSAMLCHHTQFDGFICSEYFKIDAAFYLCTLSMSRAVYGHHVAHDLDSMAKRHGLQGKVHKSALVNTKGKAQLTPEEEHALGEYSVDDCDDTAASFHAMYKHVPDDELRLIDLTIRMFVRPLLYVDVPRVEAELARELGAKAAVLESCGASPSDLMSNEKFAELLRKAGATLPMKTSPSTGQLTYAFAKSDLDFQELAKSSNKQIAALCAARLRIKSTIGETRAVRFLEAGKEGRRLPVYLNYYGAHTGRWSGGNKLNLQNLPRGGELRRAIVAALDAQRKKFAIVVADSSQIEARLTAWLANEEWLVEAFRAGRDIYSEFASDIYGRPVDRKRPAKNSQGQFLNRNGEVVLRKEDAYFPDYLEGFVGKVSILGLGYGMGALKFDLTLRQGSMGPPVTLPEGMPAQIVQIYRARNPKIVALWRKMDYIIFCMATGIEGTYGPLSYGKGYIRLPNGMFLLYPDLQGTLDDRGRLVDASYATRRGRAKIYGGLLTENVAQALARVIIGEQMLKVDDIDVPIVTMSHDEIVALAPVARAEKVYQSMLKIMSTPPAWGKDIPLAAEGGWDVNYSK